MSFSGRAIDIILSVELYHDDTFAIVTRFGFIYSAETLHITDGNWRRITYQGHNFSEKSQKHLVLSSETFSEKLTKIYQYMLGRVKKL